MQMATKGAAFFESVVTDTAQSVGDIGTALRHARERLGMTAAEAARRLHMRTMFVEALER